MAKYKNQKNIIFLTLISLLLGLMVMISINTQQASEVQSENNNQELADYIEEMEAENALLETLLQTTRQQLENLEGSEEEDQTYITQLNAALNSLTINAQMTALEGPGLVITLNDNKTDAEYAKKNNPATYRPEQYIIHDKDILYIIRSLAGNTEACTINGIRLADTTSIRCVGTTILVDSNRLAAPYEIKLLGDPDKLEDALLHCATYNNLKYYKMPVEYTKEESISVAAYAKGYSTLFTMLEEDANPADDNAAADQ